MAAEDALGRSGADHKEKFQPIHLDIPMGKGRVLSRDLGLGFVLVRHKKLGIYIARDASKKIKVERLESPPVIIDAQPQVRGLLPRIVVLSPNVSSITVGEEEYFISAKVSERGRKLGVDITPTVPLYEVKEEVPVGQLENHMYYLRDRALRIRRVLPAEVVEDVPGENGDVSDGEVGIGSVA